MDLQTILNLAIGVVTAVIMPLLAMLVTRIKTAEDVATKAAMDLQAYKTIVAENYISVRRFEGFEDALFKKLDAIWDKLDDKADKP